MTMQEMIEGKFGEGSTDQVLQIIKDMQKNSNINLFRIDHLQTGTHFACQLKEEHPDYILDRCIREGFGMAAVAIYQGGCCEK